MGHIQEIKKMLLLCGFSENDFEKIKEILFQYYKHYLHEIEEKIELFTCNKNDFHVMMKILWNHKQQLNMIESDIFYDIYSRYFSNDEQKINLKKCDPFLYWTQMYEKEKTPDEELFEKFLELI